MTHGHGWRIRLTTTAESDLRNILRWTAGQFGHAQAGFYSETLTRAIQALTDGPHIAGSRRRDGIAQGLMTLHVARGGRKGRHFVLYRVSESAEAPTIEVLRLLHDSMDLVRHVGSATDDSPLG
ncbi:MAG: type II toxin-antitoxin system RelE/ParE family toxin [Rhodospirillales bacterium]|nr:type II toxin-antitoxin system RelE/ParE family toxin [Rhodospirillales bacterium]